MGLAETLRGFMFQFFCWCLVEEGQSWPKSYFLLTHLWSWRSLFDCIYAVLRWMSGKPNQVIRKPGELTRDSLPCHLHILKSWGSLSSSLYLEHLPILIYCVLSSFRLCCGCGCNRDDLERRNNSMLAGTVACTSTSV